jgi:predicted acylesterase/phospholipase RssA
MSTVKRALVISGGGSKGAFAVGAAQFLMGQLGLEFDLFVGTSTGALITPMLAALGRDALPKLKTEYTTVRTQDIITPRQPEETAIVHSSVFTTEPLAKRIAGNVTADVFQKLSTGPRQVIVTSVNLRTGRLTYHHTGTGGFQTNGDLVRAADRDTLMRAMLASASIPVLMQPAGLGPGGAGDPFVDGGVREYAPIQVAIDAGATDIVAILLAPKDRGPAKENLGRLTGVLQRTIDILTEEVGEGNVRMAQLYTTGARYLQAVRDGLVRDHGLTAAQADSALAPAAAQNPFLGKRAVSLRVIRPTQPLQGQTLGFDPAAMQANLDTGFQTAQIQWPTGVLV